MASITALYRYPVKGLSPERLDGVDLAPGQGFPIDREYALALPETVFDAADPQPLRKTSFAVLVRHAKLARLGTRLDAATRTLTVAERGGGRVEGALDTADGRRRVEDWLEGFIGADVGGRVRIVAAPGHRFTDVSVMSRQFMMAVSVINLASVRDLEARIGATIDPLRFRANVYIDGLPAWSELEWVDRPVRLGGVACVGARRTRRCAATEVNPATAERDLAIPRLIQEHYGHPDMGTYVFVEGSGHIAPGTAVDVG